MPDTHHPDHTPSPTRTIETFSDYVEMSYGAEETVFTDRQGGEVPGAFLVGLLRGPADPRSPIWHDCVGWATQRMKDAIQMTAEDTTAGLSAAGAPSEGIRPGVMRTMMQTMSEDLMMDGGPDLGPLSVPAFASVASDDQLTAFSHHVLGNLPRVFRLQADEPDAPQENGRLRMAG